MTGARPGAALPSLLPLAPAALAEGALRAAMRGGLRGGSRAWRWCTRSARRSPPARFAAATRSRRSILATAGCRRPTCARPSPRARGRSCGELPPPDACARRLPTCARLQFLHHPAPDVALATLEGPQPSRQRLKFEELLAQQLAAEGARSNASASARRSSAPGRGGTEKLLAVPALRAHRAQRRVVEEIARDPGARDAHAPPAAGRRRPGQDRGGRARRRHRHRKGWQCADGAHRDPRRAAPAQAGRLADAAGHHGGLAHRQPARSARADAGERLRRSRRWWWHARGDPGQVEFAGWAWRSSTSSIASAWRSGLAALQAAEGGPAGPLEPHR